MMLVALGADGELGTGTACGRTSTFARRGANVSHYSDFVVGTPGYDEWLEPSRGHFTRGGHREMKSPGSASTWSWTNGWSSRRSPRRSFTKLPRGKCTTTFARLGFR